MELKSVPDHYKTEQYLCVVCKNLITLKSLVTVSKNNYTIFKALLIKKILLQYTQLIPE